MKAFEELKETTKKDIIIDGIMRSKGVYLLVSKPKVGKSLFALQLANSIANKKAFLGHEILKPSPVLYITTELSDSQLKDRCNLLGISFEKNKFFVIDRDEKQNINFMDIEYQVKEFAEEYNGKVLPIEVKSGKDYTKHSALNNVLINRDYKVEEAIVFSSYNVSKEGKVIYLPIYMVMFLNEDSLVLPAKKKLDLSDL